MTRSNRLSKFNRRQMSLVLVGVILAVLFYTGGVPSNPPGFYIDESSISYNAHTVSQSGRDEHGVSWPLFFRAFGDYKNPVFIYLLAGLFKLSGPSILIARLLSAACVFAACLVLGMLAARITGKQEVGFLTAINALLTPWLFEISRVVIEVALYPLAVALFLLSLYSASLKTRWSLLDVGRLTLTLALLTYTYSIGRLLAPLFALGLIFFITRQRWRSIVLTWGAYALSLVPLFVFNARNPGALTARFKIITYITSQDSYWQIAVDFFKHFIGNINPWRLLFTGDPNPNQVVHIFGTGHMLLATVFFAGFGLWLTLRDHGRSAWWRFILYGVIMSIVPASLTVDPFHMLRLVALPIFLLVLSVPALDWFVERFRTGTMWRPIFAGVLALTLIQAGVFYWQFRTTMSATRLHLFDAEYPGNILAPALESSSRPIYIADAAWIPGYIQAYWHATLQKKDVSQFVLLPPSEYPPPGAIVITTEEKCFRCTVLSKSEPYTLYQAGAAGPSRGPLSDEGFSAQIYSVAPPTQLRSRVKETIRVSVRNTSKVIWLARERGAAPYQISLGNHWLDDQGQMLTADDGRTALTEALQPGGEIELSLTVNTPRKPGQYILEIDMLQEGVAWFGLKGSPTLRLPVKIE